MGINGHPVKCREGRGIICPALLIFEVATGGRARTSSSGICTIQGLATQIVPALNTLTLDEMPLLDWISPTLLWNINKDDRNTPVQGRDKVHIEFQENLMAMINPPCPLGSQVETTQKRDVSSPNGIIRSAFTKDVFIAPLLLSGFDVLLEIPELPVPREGCLLFTDLLIEERTDLAFRLSENPFAPPPTIATSSPTNVCICCACAFSSSEAAADSSALAEFC